MADTPRTSDDPVARHEPGSREDPDASGDGGARVRARVKHPVAWLRARATRRHGVTTSATVPVGADEVLERLATLPLSTWTYGFDEPSVRHLGPMAQDFAERFGLGSSDRHIDAVDANGICMAAIQALYRRVRTLEDEVRDLRTQSTPRV